MISNHCGTSGFGFFFEGGGRWYSQSKSLRVPQNLKQLVPQWFEIINLGPAGKDIAQKILWFFVCGKWCC